MNHKLKVNNLMLIFLAVWWVAIGQILYKNSPVLADQSLSVQSVTDLGNIGRPSNVLTRDGGASALLGNNILWTFNDTIYQTTDSSPETPSDWRSSTSATASLGNPTATTDNIGAHGIPPQLIPYNSTELAYNQASGNGDNRYALWPNSTVQLNSSTSLIFFTQLIVHPGILNYQLLGIGTAQINVGDSVASRNPSLLFSGSDPLFNTAAVYGNTLYLYGCTYNSYSQQSPCDVARAPLSEAQDRSAYQAWNGSGWGNIDQAEPVINGSTAGFAVYWNPAINQFISMYMPGFSNSVYYSLSSNPQGPWSTPQLLFNAEPPPVNGTVDDYALQVHPELSPSGQNIYVTYYRPEGSVNSFSGNLHLIKVTLNISAPISQQGPTNSSGNSGSSTTKTGSKSSTTKIPNSTAKSKNSTIIPSGSTKPSGQNTNSSTKNSFISRYSWPISISVTLLIIGGGMYIKHLLHMIEKKKEISHHFPFGYQG